MAYTRRNLTQRAAYEDRDALLNLVEQYISSYLCNLLPNGQEARFCLEVRNVIQQGYRSDIDKYLGAEFKKMYQYGRGDTFEDEVDYATKHLPQLQDTIMRLIFLSLAALEMGLPPEEIYRADAMESVLPRLSYAMQVAAARAELVQALMEENGTISPASLALLCDVVYTYIIKVIRAKDLEATKINRQWHIPAKAAVGFLRNYAYPVDTIMKKIRKSNTNYKY